MKTLKLLLLFLLTAGTFFSCITNSSEEEERTYGEALDFEPASIPQLQEVPTPDSVNISVYITGIRECPKDVICVAPDRIIVSESIPAQDSIEINMVNPSQMNLHQQYDISLEVTQRENHDFRDLHLLGYSERINNSAEE